MSDSEIEARIGHRFRDSSLLEHALRHPSCASPAASESQYERLEFLGDAVLSLVLSEYLFRVYSDFSEGRLTRLRSALSNRIALLRVAEELELARFIRVGKGERLDSGPARRSILADACEALIGAIYLDGGLIAARAFIHRAWERSLEGVERASRMLNPKGRLQELLQERHKRQPVYRLVSAAGQAHEMDFEVTVEFDGTALGIGRGRSKKLAEKRAAEAALERLENGSAGVDPTREAAPPSNP